MRKQAAADVVVREITDDLWFFADTCNVFLLKTGRRAVAIDFGSGLWLDRLPKLGIDGIDHVLLTHHHADQCAGLQGRQSRPFVAHAPAGEEPFLDPARISEFKRSLAVKPYIPFPASYAPLRKGIPGVVYDVRPNFELFLNGLCFRCVHTPGHGRHACSYVVEFHGRQFCFCGDAAHVGGTVWAPYNLEWDHWTGTGALAAWEGIRRLEGIGMDRLCPAHGAPIIERPMPALRLLDRRLLDFYRAKGSVCAGEKDHWLIAEPVADGIKKVLPHLYMGRSNAYLLRSNSGADLIVDATEADIKRFKDLLGDSFCPKAALVTHAHSDHYAGVSVLQKRYGTKLYLHPQIAEGITDHLYRHALFRARHPPRIDHIWPAKGRWQWHEYTFDVAPWPGQTWWHCVFMTAIDGQKVLFGGDSFQPASRWNGTGGFCAANLSRFQDGFVASAKLVLRWQPDILANGHCGLFRFTATRFRRIIKWARFAEKTLQALCPSGSLEQDYYFPLNP